MKAQLKYCPDLRACVLEDRPANGAGPLRAGVALAEARDDSRPPPAGATTHPDHRAADVSTDPPPATSPPASVAPSHPWRKALLWAGAVAGLAVGAYFLAPTVKTMLDTVSTDDAYVNGHVTYVAPRVAGQVSRVLVDDNDRVSKGDLLVQLDREPYQVQVDLKKAAGRQRRGRPGGRAGPGPGHPGPGPEPALEAPEGDRGCRRQGGAAPGPGRGPAGQGGDPRPRQGRPRPSQATFQPERDLPRGVRPAPRLPSGRPRPRSSRPLRRSTRRESPSASTRTPRGRT